MTNPPSQLQLIVTPGPKSYALLDTGNGRKLERFGAVVVDRPEPQAMWSPGLPRADWAKANAAFSASAEDEEKGRWRIDRPVPEAWPVDVEGATMKLRLAGLWHLGVFPEQLPHWQWMVSQLASPTALSSPVSPQASLRLDVGEVPRRGGVGASPEEGPPPPPPALRATSPTGGEAKKQKRVLNLFGYTGAASLIAARTGAEVVHVDASKKAIAWARENAAASGLADAPVRWLCEDARKFVAREVRRGRTYHSILLDPPKFGRGPDGEVWDLFEHLPTMLADCAKLLAPEGASLILTAYAIRASSLALDGLMRETLEPRGGAIESGELALCEASGRRLLGTSLYARWSAP